MAGSDLSSIHVEYSVKGFRGLDDQGNPTKVVNRNGQFKKSYTNKGRSVKQVFKTKNQLNQSAEKFEAQKDLTQRRAKIILNGVKNGAHIEHELVKLYSGRSKAINKSARVKLTNNDVLRFMAIEIMRCDRPEKITEIAERINKLDGHVDDKVVIKLQHKLEQHCKIITKKLIKTKAPATKIINKMEPADRLNDLKTYTDNINAWVKAITPINPLALQEKDIDKTVKNIIKVYIANLKPDTNDLQNILSTKAAVDKIIDASNDILQDLGLREPLSSKTLDQFYTKFTKPIQNIQNWVVEAQNLKSKLTTLKNQSSFISSSKTHNKSIENVQKQLRMAYDEIHSFGVQYGNTIRAMPEFASLPKNLKKPSVDAIINAYTPFAATTLPTIEQTIEPTDNFDQDVEFHLPPSYNEAMSSTINNPNLNSNDIAQFNRLIQENVETKSIDEALITEFLAIFSEAANTNFGTDQEPSYHDGQHLFDGLSDGLEMLQKGGAVEDAQNAFYKRLSQS